jgi:hypothetical protein
MIRVSTVSHSCVFQKEMRTQSKDADAAHKKRIIPTFEPKYLIKQSHTNICLVLGFGQIFRGISLCQRSPNTARAY